MWPLSFPKKEKLKQKYYPLSDIRKSRRAQSEILMRMGLISAAAQKAHFLHYSVTKRYAYLGYFHISTQYQSFSLSKFLIQSCIPVSLQN